MHLYQTEIHSNFDEELLATTQENIDLQEDLKYINSKGSGCNGQDDLGSYTDVNSENDCAQRCLNNNACVSFEYKKSNKKCYLSTTCAFPSKGKDSNYVHKRKRHLLHPSG
jgi:hypothetical protein